MSSSWTSPSRRTATWPTRRARSPHHHARSFRCGRSMRSTANLRPSRFAKGLRPAAKNQFRPGGLVREVSRAIEREVRRRGVCGRSRTSPDITATRRTIKKHEAPTIPTSSTTSRRRPRAERHPPGLVDGDRGNHHRRLEGRVALRLRDGWRSARATSSLAQHEESMTQREVDTVTACPTFQATAVGGQQRKK